MKLPSPVLPSHGLDFLKRCNTLLTIFAVGIQFKQNLTPKYVQGITRFTTFIPYLTLLWLEF